MEQIKDGTRYAETYWSMPEFVDMAEKRADSARQYADGEVDGDRSDFTGVRSFAEALAMGRSGWSDELPEALAVAESAVKMANREHMVDAFLPQWDVTGGEVDVARYLQGEPECMIDFPLTRTSKSGRVITLVVGTSISATISAETYIRRGQCIVALALALNTLGHALEIWAEANTRCNDKSQRHIYQRVMVKSASDEIDPAAIMFALAHPAMHRALMWATWDGFPAPWKGGVSLARFRGVPRSTIGSADMALYPEGTIFLPGIRSSTDVPDADEFLRKYLGELGLLVE